MIKLNKFGKLGVRVPASLKRKVKQLCLDMDAEGIKFNEDELSMEAAFDVAMLELLSMGPAEQRNVFARRLPELMGMFEAEVPHEKPAEGTVGDRLGDGGVLKPSVYPSKRKAKDA